MLSRRNMKRTRAVALGLVASSALVAAGPCDIYASGGTPCVAAHSTTRALYSAYTGKLYQVKRADGKTTDVSPLAAGGVANAATQDDFCKGTTCLISIIYDQSGRGNHLTQAPPGGFNGPAANGYDNLASATGAPVTLNGRKAYGVFVAPGTGYRNNKPNGTAKGDSAEGIYGVFDGTHYNGACCFDYGNAETSSKDTGAGHMEAIYFGSCTVWGSGNGKGPWIMADLENGLFSGQGSKKNTNDPTVSHRFTTAVVKGAANNKWAIRGGDATTGDIATFYSGVRPSGGYNPMKKEGAIILGIGGDNSHGAQGTFYEGAMTASYPSDATEAAVQADIVAAKYAVGSASTAKTVLTPGSTVSLRAAGTSDQYLAHRGEGSALATTSLTKRDTTTLQHSTWIIRSGLGNPACFSLESSSVPGSFARHADFALVLHADDGSKQFREDATFCTQEALGSAVDDDAHLALRSWNHPSRYVRRFADATYAAANDGEGVHAFDGVEGFHEDANWVVEVV